MSRRPLIKCIVLLALSLMARTELVSRHQSTSDEFWTPALQKCKNCPTDLQITQPGIGFALEMGYGTAAVRWHNGTIQPTIRVEGSPSYKELMRRLSYTTPNTRFPDEIPTMAGKMEYVRRRLARTVNKLLGRPANQQTAIFAEMLAQLQTSVAKALPSGTRGSVMHAVVTSPDAIRLTAEEIGDILGYLKISNLMAEPDELFAASAAFAGFGHGLCKSYTKPYVCEREDFELPWKQVLHLDFSDAALTMAIKGMKSYKRLGTDATTIVPELGYAHAEVEGGEALFNKLSDHIHKFATSSRNKITEVLLTGARVENERFKDAVKGALSTYGSDGAMKSFDNFKQIDFVFATAKGAAEIAKRRLEGPVRCIWSHECKITDMSVGERDDEDSKMELK